MKVHVMTLFPEMIAAGVNSSILKKATEKDLLRIEAVNIRDYSTDKHKKVDDYPYGGGAGMLMQAQPIYDAYMAITEGKKKKVRTIYLTPQGPTFHQKMAEDFAKEEELIFLCGHYEGIDERVLEEIVTDYVSIGDYVLTGGELPSLVMIDAIARLIPEVLHNDISAETESFHRDLLEYPQYSRPEVWMGKEVPKVLLSGNRRDITKWRLEESCKRTKERRPDLYQKYLHLEQILQRMKKKKRNYIYQMESLSTGRGTLKYEGEAENAIIVCEKLAKELLVEGLSDGELQTIFGTVQILLAGEPVPMDYEIVTSQEELKDYLLQHRDGVVVKREMLGCYTRRESISQRRKDIEILPTEQLQDTYRTITLQKKEDPSIPDFPMTYGYVCKEEDQLLGFVAGKCIGRIDYLWVADWTKKDEVAKSLLAVATNEALQNDMTAILRLPTEQVEAKKVAEECGFIFSENCLWNIRMGR